MVKIVATADLHGELPEIAECDLLLLAGDLCPEVEPRVQARWLDGPFRKWLNEIPAGEVVCIAGNHDLIFEGNKELVPPGLRCRYLEDSLIELFGLRIYGTPWQLPFWGAFNLQENALAEKYRDIPSKIDIFMSHAPPYCIADGVPVRDEILHTGSVSLRKKAFEIRPKLFICGHIHCAYGIVELEDIIFANVSLLDDSMIAVNPPVVFEL